MSLNCIRICHRRLDERKVTSWGERCVDVFSNLEIIGEGTYGLVYKAKEANTGKFVFFKEKIQIQKIQCICFLVSFVTTEILLST